MEHHRKRPHLLRTDMADRSAARATQRAHRSGDVVLIRQGVYMPRGEWEALEETGRHLARARAVAPELEEGTGFSHVTAALALGWPLIGPAPERVHVIDDRRTTTVHRAGLVRHAGPLPAVDPVRLDGVPVTAPVPTAVALIVSAPVHVAAVAVDAAVRARVIEPSRLAEELPLGPARGSARAQLVLSALDERHESPGESFTAIRLVEIGAPATIPQHEFVLPDGRRDRLDFWLPSRGLVVEFDGKQKYRDPTMIGTSDPAEVLWREKVREDRIRSRPKVRAVIRVTWWHLVEPDRLRALFRAHGVRL
ncbi:hypothetical protein DEI89_03500 [Curtobacterium sp. MCBD17_030]|nr:hypothetical protein DEI89_03500 [Curtobacterium sp. MCBD17_030]